MTRVVLGAQWGDEGKAKVIDFLAKDYDYVVRFQGGANAGHTVYVGQKKYVFHLVPSGILRPEVKVIVGNGLVIDLEEFLKEVDLVSADIDTTGRIMLSDRAHVVLPFHKLLDAAKEARTANKIGTTLRGIGPAYADKVSRLGIRVGDIFSPHLKEKIENAIDTKYFLLENYYEMKKLPPVDEIYEYLLQLGKRIHSFVAPTEKILRSALQEGKRVLFEGAQGSLLDIDFGTYPYVTSSSTTAAGAIAGSGAGYIKDLKVTGIIKAYTTRVGEGPFPTEDTGSTGENLRKSGNEFGATTGRPRRCGWFDSVMSSYSIGVAGINELFLTKLDVLDGMDFIKVGIGYRKGKEILDYPPSQVEQLQEIEVLYETFPGWKQSTAGIKEWDKLPLEARNYIKYLEDTLKTPIHFISTGKERDAVIVR